MNAFFVDVPFAVDISESALLFTSGSTPFDAYLLAVLELIVIAPAAVVHLASIFEFSPT